MENNSKRFQAVYAIVEKPNGKDVFMRVGAAFPNKDGSLTLLLDAIPISGKLQVRDYTPREHLERPPAAEPASARAV
jgi:hypothetical protein